MDTRNVGATRLAHDLAVDNTVQDSYANSSTWAADGDLMSSTSYSRPVGGRGDSTV